MPCYDIMRIKKDVIIIKTRKNLDIIILMTILIFLMYVVDSHIQPGYFMKSIIKIILFLIVPIMFAYKNYNIISIHRLFRLTSLKQAIVPITLALVVYGFIMIAYFILKNFINLDNIQNILSSSLNVSKSNFIYVAFYISFINSFLEESFFRGFIFLNLKKTMKKPISYFISAVAFSVYHVAILSNWFNPVLFIVALIGLFIGGLILNWLNSKSENIYNSWVVHMFANFAINTVGLIMYEII